MNTFPNMDRFSFLAGLTVGILATAVVCFALWVFATWLRNRAAGSARRELENSFRALASQVLAESNEQFLALADQRLQTAQEVGSAEIESRKQAIAALVEPLASSLKTAMEKVESIEMSRERAAGALAQELGGLQQTNQLLRQETASLASALRRPQARGRWGELQLRRTVEIAGMINRVDFVEQASTTSEDGDTLRPDAVVTLPGNRLVIIDSKCPLDAYLAALDSQDEGTRSDALARHARHIRDHAARLGQKGYWKQFEDAADFVIMFIPGEAFFSAALESDPSLIEACSNQRVVLATPTTLIAMLRAVAQGWRQESLAASAREICKIGAELHDRINVFLGHISATGKAINDAALAHNKALASLERRLAPSARKLADLGAAERAAEVPSPIDAAAIVQTAGSDPGTATLSREDSQTPP